MIAGSGTRLVGARSSRPRFGFPWLALVLGVATLVFVGFGLSAVTAEPNSHVSIIVEGDLPRNISQETVDAAHPEPIPSWEPITFKVTGEYLTFDEQNRQADPGADVVLSTQWKSDQGSREEARFVGAAVRSSVENRYEIGHSYIKNLGLGHGPLAVVAAAETAADVLDDGPIRTPVFWLTGTALGILLAGAALAAALRRRTRWEARYRRLAAAQRKLARVVLDLEALEVTYSTTPERARPAGYTAAWRKLRDSTLTLARTEEPVVEAIWARKTALGKETLTLLERFESTARQLTGLADALVAAGAVHANLARRRAVYERLSAPLNDAARELLIRLEAAPGNLLSTKTTTELRTNLGALLEATARGTNHAGRTTANAHAGVKAWARAEHDLEETARHIADVLRHYPHGLIRARQRDTEDLTELRESLGLPRQQSLALSALDEANAAARALLGDVEAYDAASPAARKHRRGHPKTGRDAVAPGARTRRIRRFWVVGSLIALVVSAIVSGLVTETVLGRPGWELTGEEHLRSITIDGHAEGIVEEDIRHYLDDKFPQPIDVTLAVRDAEEYLKVGHDAGSTGSVELDPAQRLHAVGQVKHEFPDLLDPVTEELHPDQAIMPVMVFDDGQVAVPAMLTGATAVGGASRLGSSMWTYPPLYVSDLSDVHLASELEDLARGLQANGFDKENVNGYLLFWLLTATLTLGLLTAAQVVQFGGSISARLGRFGRGGAALRRAKAQLDELAIGLDDSRLNAVAVLGSGAAATSAGAGQRLFERALVMAWREADDLAALPLSARLRQGYLERVAHLQRLVATLGERDADVQRRTAALLEATRGAGGR